MSLDGINGLNLNTNIRKPTSIQKTNGLEPLFNLNGVDNKGFYPGLNFSPEAKMQAEMNKSSFMQNLNELFGIN